MPDDWKSIGSVGRGVYEIRIRSGQEHRVFFVARFDEAVYVLHAFEKRTQKTAQADLELGRRRLAEVLRAKQKP
jgi:phage-related protein